jgi:hypothetical protein
MRTVANQVGLDGAGNLSSFRPGRAVAQRPMLLSQAADALGTASRLARAAQPASAYTSANVLRP